MDVEVSETGRKAKKASRTREDAPIDELGRDITASMTLMRLADFVPPNAPNVFRAAVQNLDELTVASLNHKRMFKGLWYAEPHYPAAIKAQETAMRLFRLLGPESGQGASDYEPTPEMLAEARRVLTARGWKEPKE